MHRVELKAFSSFGGIIHHPAPVPNAPCGVESFSSAPLFVQKMQFLMHRVELKARPIRLSLPP